MTRTVREGGAGGADRGTTTTVRASLLRAPRFPDPHTDQGTHSFRHALVPGASIGDAVREGYLINLPERRVPGDADVAPLVAVDNDDVVVSALKLADDASGDVIVRLYEARGGRAEAHLTTSFAFGGGVRTCDLLERPYDTGDDYGDAVPGPVEAVDAGTVRVRLRPFELVTLRLTPQDRW